MSRTELLNLGAFLPEIATYLRNPRLGEGTVVDHSGRYGRRDIMQGFQERFGEFTPRTLQRLFGAFNMNTGIGKKGIGSDFYIFFPKPTTAENGDTIEKPGFYAMQVPFLASPTSLENASSTISWTLNPNDGLRTLTLSGVRKDGRICVAQYIAHSEDAFYKMARLDVSLKPGEKALLEETVFNIQDGALPGTISAMMIKKTKATQRYLFAGDQMAALSDKIVPDLVGGNEDQIPYMIPIDGNS